MISHSLYYLLFIYLHNASIMVGALDETFPRFKELIRSSDKEQTKDETKESYTKANWLVALWQIAL